MIERCKIYLTAGTRGEDDYKELVLPIPPESFEVQTKQNNETVTIHSLGEVNLVGKRNLRTLSLSSFFPGSVYEFAVTEYKGEPYTAYTNVLEKWKDTGAVVQVLIVGTPISWPATIEELNYGESDASGDVNFTLQLKEYRDPAGRVTKKTKTTKVTVKKGDTLNKLAKKYLGATKYASAIYRQNKKTIDRAVKKAMTKKWKTWVKAHNKKLPKSKRLKFSSKSVQKKLKADLKKNRYKLYKGTIIYISRTVMK